jgi:4-carboxymuconolactone decarboxylase
MRHTLTILVALGFARVAPALAQDAGRLVVTHAASRTSYVAPAANFTGHARIETLFDTTATTRAYGGSVAFDAGARTAWHTHARGQVLIVTAGVGRVQRWGGPVEEIRAGDVVRIPPGVKHWHGAAPTSAMTHIGIVEQGGGGTTAWLEQVTDEQYDVRPSAPETPPPAPARGASDSAQPSAAQRLMGDIAPKLALLTDSVLFGDVWARPGLSRRDRSLVTVSALVAMNRPDQLRSHLALARQNGVTQDELVEAITQLAFYAGWPNAISAVTVAREVFAGTRR